MTDFSKYKNISIKKETYAKIDKIRKVLAVKWDAIKKKTHPDKGVGFL